MSLPRRPEFNHAVGFLGRVNAGKTTAAVHRLRAFRREHPCYIIAHDARYAIPDKLHDGTPTGVRRYRSVAELERGLAAHPEGIHVCAESDGLTTIRFAKAYAYRSMHRADPKGHAAPCPPVVLYVDEVANVDGMTERKLGDDVRDALLQRRHNHVAFVWGTQNPSRVHYDLLADHTELHVAHLSKHRDLVRLDEEADLSEAELRIVESLPPYKFHCHKPGVNVPEGTNKGNRQGMVGVAARRR